MPALERSIELAARHSIYIQRFGGGLANQFDEFAERLKKEIAWRLINEPTANVTGPKLRAILRDITAIQTGIYAEYTDQVFQQLQLFAESEGDFQAQSLSDVVDIDTQVPTATQLWSAVTQNPLIFPDQNVTKFIDPFIKDWTDKEIKRVASIVETGFATGETTDSMARRLTGKGNHIDKRARVNAKNMVRTAVNHTATQARLRTNEENSDIVIGYEWISVLDGRTSTICRALDGKEFLHRKKSSQYQPKPPQHIACRSSTAPIVDKRYSVDRSGAQRSSLQGPISADMSYYDFLKTQDKAFVDDVLGNKLGKLFREGGLSTTEFAKLTVDEKYRPLTLKEIRERNKLLFDKVGI